MAPCTHVSTVRSNTLVRVKPPIVSFPTPHNHVIIYATFTVSQLKSFTPLLSFVHTTKHEIYMLHRTVKGRYWLPCRLHNPPQLNTDNGTVKVVREKISPLQVSDDTRGTKTTTYYECGKNDGHAYQGKHGSDVLWCVVSSAVSHCLGLSVYRNNKV